MTDDETYGPCECVPGPSGEHCDVVAVCDECLKPTCDFCGYGHNDEEDDWLCPDHAPEGKART
jgi:hypothetical protein